MKTPGLAREINVEPPFDSSSSIYLISMSMRERNDAIRCRNLAAPPAESLCVSDFHNYILYLCVMRTRTAQKTDIDTYHYFPKMHRATAVTAATL